MRVSPALFLVSSTAILACANPAFAQIQSDQTGAWVLFHGTPKVKTTHGYWKIRGRIFWDAASLKETRNGQAENSFSDTEFRAARIGLQGQYDHFKYKAEVDFGGGKTTAKDVNISWHGPVVVTVGQMIAGGSMQEITSSRHIAFTERAMFTDAIGFDRRIGVKLSKGGHNYSWAAGVYGNSIDGAIDGKSTNTVWAARASYAPILEKGRVVHVGAHLRHTKRARGGPKHSSRWGPHLAREKVKPKVGDNATLYGVELATVQGPFYAQAEYMKEDGDLGSVKGGFLQAGVFLTGETRKYKASAGKFDRTKPLKPLSKGGYGGFELAARFDTVDARNAADEKVDAWSVGLNWYPESHLRVKLDYTDASGDTFNAKGLYTRLQIDW